MRMVRVRCRGLLHGGAMILLRQGGRGDRRDEDAHERLHAASPSSGRTVTTRNIPACMWSSRWQWKAQSPGRSEEHTSELQSLMRNSYAVFCLKNKTKTTHFKQTSTALINYNREQKKTNDKLNRYND